MSRPDPPEAAVAGPSRFDVPQVPSFSLRYLELRRTLPPAPPGARRYALFMGRNSLFQAVSLLHIAPGRTILVPAYVCRAAVEPLRAAGARVEFYAVSRRCELELDDLAARIRPATAAVLAVHYFGFPTVIERLRRLCDERGIALIEDCAHVLLGQVSGRPLGAFGDVSMFSWRKFLPIHDGSTLQVNAPHAAPPLDLGAAPPRVLARSAIHALDGAPFVASAGRLGRRLLRRGAATAAAEGRSAPARPTIPDPTSGEDFLPETAAFAMTAPSRLVLEHADLPAIAAARRANYEALAGHLEATPGVTLLHAAPPPGGAPWVFPLIFESRRDAHKRIRELGVPAQAWDGVRPRELTEESPDTDFLYHHLVFLPVHQGLSAAHLERIAHAVERAAS